MPDGSGLSQAEPCGLGPSGFDPSRIGVTYESEGPKCPYCGRQFTADEACYYDELRYTQDDCDECGRTFDVEVYHSVSWRCSPRDSDGSPQGGDACGSVACDDSSPEPSPSKQIEED